MKLDWKRVERTAVQSAAGAGIALITAISSDWSKAAVVTALVQFGTTVAIAVLMNIKEQSGGEEK